LGHGIKEVMNSADPGETAKETPGDGVNPLSDHRNVSVNRSFHQFPFIMSTWLQGRLFNLQVIFCLSKVYRRKKRSYAF